MYFYIVMYLYLFNFYFVFLLVAGGWTSWSSYSACNTKCGTGVQIRKRSCTNPKPQYGGDYFPGSIEDIQQCNLHKCPSKHSILTKSNVLLFHTSIPAGELIYGIHYVDKIDFVTCISHLIQYYVINTIVVGRGKGKITM